MPSVPLSSRLLAGVAVVVIASIGVLAAGQRGGQNPAPRGGGRGAPPVRDTRPAADAPAGTSSIVGTVVVAGSGAPARRARVMLNGEALRGSRSVITDDQGRYAFAALPGGRFTLSASKVGHLAVTYGQRVPGSGRPGTPIQLEDGQRLTIALQMPRGGVISGTVLDEQGEAIPGTQVRAFRYSMQSGVRTLQVAGADATDDRGIFRIYGLSLGDYLICATPRSPGPSGGPGIDRLQEAVAAMAPQAGAAGQQVAAAVLDRIAARTAQGQPATDEPSTGYAPVYYPGTTNTSNATAVALGVGEEKLGMDFQLQLVPMARVEGMVIYPSGQEPGGLQVQLVQIGEDRGIGGNSTRVGRDGSFSFSNVAPGQYALTARTGGQGPMAALPDNLTGGRGGRGAPGGPGGQGPEGPGGRGGGRGTGAPRLWASTEIAVDGRTLSNLVLTLQPGFSMTGRVEFRGTTEKPPADLTRVRVTLTPSNLTAGGLVVASAAPGRVDESGHFTIDGVVPGRYRLTAGGVTGWSLESAMLSGQDTLDFPVDIRSAQNLTGAAVTFTDQQTTVSGTVTNVQGQAVSDYTVIVYPTDQRFWQPQARRIRSLRPATDGTFSVSGLPPGDYRLAPVLDPDPGSWFDAAFLQQLDGVSDRFTLTDGEKKVQNVRAGS